MAIIAISRGTFSGGEALAKRVAERLGYQCIGREMNLEVVTKDYDISPDGLMAAMEKRPSFLERVVGEHTVYLTCVRAALCGQAQGDRLVYHGYLGHLLLPGVSHVIGVRVIADMEFRLQAVPPEKHFTREEAIAHIHKVDKDRREWTRFLFGVDWDDPHLYAIVLNLSRISLDLACEMLVQVTERDEFQPTAASIKAMRDLTLSSQVSAKLARDFRTRDADLKVTADDGIVTIVGTTPWAEIVDAVPVVARGVEGVKEVRTDVTGVTPLHPLNFY